MKRYAKGDTRTHRISRTLGARGRRPDRSDAPNRAQSERKRVSSEQRLSHFAAPLSGRSPIVVVSEVVCAVSFRPRRRRPRSVRPSAPRTSRARRISTTHARFAVDARVRCALNGFPLINNDGESAYTGVEMRRKRALPSLAQSLSLSAARPIRVCARDDCDLRFDGCVANGTEIVSPTPDYARFPDDSRNYTAAAPFLRYRFLAVRRQRFDGIV